MNELITIQSRLKAPKSQYNSFGKYKYRNCEDILEAVKPLLAETNTFLTISDEIIQIGERYYIKASVHLYKSDGTLISHVSALAREAETKKGMDESQLTGSTSSYARKYALNGLFAIDDTKDSDATNKHNDKTETRQTKTHTPTQQLSNSDVSGIKKAQPMTDQQKNAITNLLGKHGMDEIQINDFLERNKLSFDRASDVIKRSDVYAKEYLELEAA